MSGAAKILMLTAILGFLAAVLVIALQGSHAPPEGPASVAATENGNDPEPKAPTAATAEPAVRTEIQREPMGATDQSGRDHEQGVVGLVVDPEGDALFGTAVYLFESPTNNPFARFSAVRSGVQFLPAARTQTDEDGRFALGIRTATDTKYEVRVISDVYADQTLRPVTIQSGDWFDAGVIRLDRGALVRGRVTIEGTQVPVQGARVTIESVDPFQDLNLASIPGREHGLTTAVDAAGFFEFRNAPGGGEVNISAVAPEFARVRKTAVHLENDQVNEVDFQLPRGLSIAGRVTDTSQVGIPEARIVATGIGEGAVGKELAFSDRNGDFEVFGLRDGTFQLEVTARDYQSQSKKPVKAGTNQAFVTLERKGIAQLEVIAPDGRPLTRYVVDILRFFAANNGHLGRSNVPQQHIRPSDLSGSIATIGGIDDSANGEYVFMVRAEGYAMTRSEPFEIGVGKPTPTLTVHITRGATLQGSVVDELGAPIVGATVETQVNGYSDDNPLTRILHNLAPEPITRAKVKTDERGSYRLPLLALGNYQLKVTHPDYCDHVRMEIQPTAPGAVEVPPLSLLRGTLVFGVARLNGRPSGQIKVVVGPPAMTGTGGATATTTVRAEAVTNSDGRFTIQRRFPPGTYEIRAAQELLQGGFFQQIMQFKQNVKQFSVLAGQAESVHDLNITTDQ